jgi:hypothetical protein
VLIAVIAAFPVGLGCGFGFWESECLDVVGDPYSGADGYGDGDPFDWFHGSGLFPHSFCYLVLQVEAFCGGFGCGGGFAQ